ncbi:MAG: hypothetical protein FJX56_08475 [Alphaproteobacteria bacterium]|nr:hypothetical protein [Alphaproteobacteria bacterium]
MERAAGGGRLARLLADCRPATVAAGYTVQEALIAQAGTPVASWKIAATSAAGQAHIRVSEPLSGPLFAPYVVADGATLDIARNRMGVVEAEFAFRFGRALGAGEAPLADDVVLAAVSALHLAIEVPDSRFEDFETVGAPSLIPMTPAPAGSCSALR